MQGLTVRLITRAPRGGMKASGTLKILPPLPPSFFHCLPPYLVFMRSAMFLASSRCCICNQANTGLSASPSKDVSENSR